MAAGKQHRQIQSPGVYLGKCIYMHPQRGQKLARGHSPGVCPMRMSNQQVLYQEYILEWMQNDSRHLELTPLRPYHNSTKQNSTSNIPWGLYADNWSYFHSSVTRTTSQLWSSSSWVSSQYCSKFILQTCSWERIWPCLPWNYSQVTYYIRIFKIIIQIKYRCWTDIYGSHWPQKCFKLCM